MCPRQVKSFPESSRWWIADTPGTEKSRYLLHLPVETFCSREGAKGLAHLHIPGSCFRFHCCAPSATGHPSCLPGGESTSASLWFSTLFLSAYTIKLHEIQAPNGHRKELALHTGHTILLYISDSQSGSQGCGFTLRAMLGSKSRSAISRSPGVPDTSTLNIIWLPFLDGPAGRRSVACVHQKAPWVRSNLEHLSLQLSTTAKTSVTASQTFMNCDLSGKEVVRNTRETGHEVPVR